MSLRIGKVEKADLSLQVSYGFILHGSLADFIKARGMLEKLEDSRLIYNTADTRRLFIVRDKSRGADTKDE